MSCLLHDTLMGLLAKISLYDDPSLTAIDNQEMDV